MSNSCNLCSQKNNSDPRLLHSSLHVQVFLPFRYALHISTWILIWRYQYKMLLFLEKNSLLLWGWYLHLTFSLFYNTVIIVSNIVSKGYKQQVVTFVLDCIHGDDHWHPREACKQAEVWEVWSFSSAIKCLNIIRRSFLRRKWKDVFDQ